ncbi:MAG: type II secretion system F family protein [Hyphomicrobiaceae bacterium]
MDNDLFQLVIFAVAGLGVAAVVGVLVWPYLSGERAAAKRIQGVTEGRQKRVARKQAAEVAQTRRKMVQDTLKELESKKSKQEKVTLRLQLQRAGLDISTKAFWISSGVVGLVVAVVTFASVPAAPPFVPLLAGFAGALGLPRWTLKFLTKRRQKKFLAEFANAIDVIVRGVKSGLPLNECLAIISREAVDPIAGEFKDLVEQQRVGIPLIEAFDRMIARMPLAEVKFFAIVVGIQQQAGGNLSEALGNLSGVLRDRKTLQMKVAALSAEAKASAYVLGALPFIVMGMVYVTTPQYISILWTTKTGQFVLLAALFWMSCGALMMKKMINFKY